MTEIDWDHMAAESDRLLEQWENMQREPLSSEHVQGFEYGFEMGYRIAKGDVL